MAVGRNEPCPCGSGRKFKKCCGPRLDKALESVRTDTELTQRLLQLADDLGLGDELADFVADCALDPDDTTPTDYQFSVPWTLFHARFDRQTLAERLGEQPGRLGDWLRSQRRAWLSVWEVLRVVPGVGLELRDVLLDEERFVYERTGSEILHPGLFLLTRVVDHEGLSVIAGVFPTPLQPTRAWRVVEEFRNQWFGRRKIRVKNLQDPELTLSLALSWREEALAGSRPPSLVNFDGDPLQMVRDTAPVRDREEARARLEGLGGDPFEEEGRWGLRLNRLPRGTQSGQRDPVMWARIVLGPDELALESNSLRRADELRDLVEGRGLGPFQRELVPLDLQAAPGPRPPVPPELAEMVRKKKEELYAGWCREPLPAFGGRSASETVRTAAGRRQVQALLQEMERLESRLPEAERFDFNRIRRELGLPEGAGR